MMRKQTAAETTRTWCPFCKSQQCCEVYEIAPTRELASAGLMEFRHEESIPALRRHRRCSACRGEFQTIELDQNTLRLLIGATANTGVRKTNWDTRLRRSEAATRALRTIYEHAIRNPSERG